MYNSYKKRGEPANMEKDYITLAHAIIPYLPENIIDYHKNILNDKALSSYLFNNYEYTSLSELLGACIKNITLAETADTATPKAILSKLKTYRRVTKGRWLAPLKDELLGHVLKKNNPGLLAKAADSYMFLLKHNKNLLNKNYNTKDDFIKHEFTEILLWKKDVKAPLIAFKFFEAKSTRCQIESFIKDLLLAAFYIIEDNFHGSYAGYVTNIPSDFLKYPIFTLIERQPYRAKIEHDPINRLYQHDYQSSDKTIVQTQLKDDSYVTKCQLDNKSITYKYPQLNPLDNELLIIIYNIFINNFLYLGNSSFTIKIKNIAKIIYPNIKTLGEKHYQNIREHLLRISHYNIQILYDKPEDSCHSTKLPINFFNSLQIYDSKREVYVEISPSMRNVIYDDKHISILTKKYRLIESNQTRIFVAVLQNERISAYLKLEDKTLPLSIDLPFSFFHSKFRIAQMTSTRLKQYIINCLVELSQKNIIISFYKINKKSVSITFDPLDETELNFYKLSDDSNK